MDLMCVTSIWVCLVLFLFINDVHGHGRGHRHYSKIFKVTNYGAIANGEIDNSQAFMNAWTNACETDGALLAVPKGTYLLKSAQFKGPCNGTTSFRIKGTLIASSHPSVLDEDAWILFYNIDGLTLFGNGTFDGNGPSAWPQSKCHKSSKCDPLPLSIKFEHVSNSTVRGITSVNSKMFHLLIDHGERITVNHVNILAPENSPNTDGIHIGNSNDVKIVNSHIATGDDCISIGAGSTNINISRVWCGPGHGISIGSLGKYTWETDVREISVTNCTFTNTTNGLRIKTWAQEMVPITVANITFANIRVNDVRNPIIIDQFYCPHSFCNNKGQSTVQIKGVKFIDVRGSSASSVAVNVQCSKRRPCKNIQFFGLDLNVTGTTERATASCFDVDDELIGINQMPLQCP